MPIERPRRREHRPTMADVAEAAGVSIKTVSRVVNGATTVDPVLAERVREASDRLGFRVNPIASSLRSGASTATIGVLTKDLSNDFYGTIVAAAAEVAARRGTHVITAHSGEQDEDELEVVRELCARRVDGLLIVPTGGNQSPFRAEIERGTPMVFIDRSPTGLAADSVLVDNVGGAKEGVAGLLAQGHRRIAVIVDTLRMRTMEDRLRGVRAAFTEAGVPFDESLVETDVATPQAARRTAARMLSEPDPPTAFFCGNNRSGIGALEHLWDAGRDEALVCFDDFPLARLMPRPLTCVDYDNRALGTIGAELLFRRIDREPFDPQTIVLPTSIVERGNTG